VALRSNEASQESSFAIVGAGSVTGIGNVAVPMTCRVTNITVLSTEMKGHAGEFCAGASIGRVFSGALAEVPNFLVSNVIGNEPKLSILAFDIHQYSKYTMQQTIFHHMKRCVEESEKTGDFQLSPLLDRQVCPPVDSQLRKFASLIGLDFTMMNQWIGNESHLVNTLIPVPIALNAWHGPFASGCRSAKFPAWRRGRKSLCTSHCTESELFKTLKTIEIRRNKPEPVRRDVKHVRRQSR
jgi:hypothetical protein